MLQLEASSCSCSYDGKGIGSGSRYLNASLRGARVGRVGLGESQRRPDDLGVEPKGCGQVAL